LAQKLHQLVPEADDEVWYEELGLTPREMDIVRAVVAGGTNKGMARRFSLGERTVKHHLTKIFGKVGVGSRLELALFAISRRLVQS
jgi:two-component system nitrate/nitrite response regulator NarL